MFHLWRNEHLVIHHKVSKYYENYCGFYNINFFALAVLTLIILIAQSWKLLSLQWLNVEMMMLYQLV